MVTLNPRFSPYILGAIALLVTVWLFNERAELRAQTDQLQHDLDSINQEDAVGALSRLGYETASSDSKSKLANALGIKQAEGEEEINVPQDIDELPEPESKYDANNDVAAAIPDDGPCVDATEKCKDWARKGECATNAAWMVGGDGLPGHCKVSCGVCEEDMPKHKSSGSTDVELPGAASHASSGFQSDELQAMDGQTTAGEPKVGSNDDKPLPVCRDLSPNCKVWQLHGECERNPEYMIGGDGYEGQCVLSCGKCPGALGDYGKTVVPEQTPFKEDSGVKVVGPDNVPMRALRWPQKRSQSGRVCIGLSTTACERGLYHPAVEKLSPTDRSTVTGVGGPTGCQEAWATLMTADDQIPGVLVLVYTLRQLSNMDRDIVVFVTPGVTDMAIKQLLTACVIVKAVNEPLDPATHMGFVKITMWLAIEYTKIVFVEHDAWFRSDPSALFEYDAPAAIKTAPHPRLLNELYGSYLQVIAPSRQTFYDMLAKVGTIDSAEAVDESGTTVFTERLFFSGYFDKWHLLPNKFLEFEADVVARIVPELTNTRIRRMIKSMPPYTQDTILNYENVVAGGVYSNVHVKPWLPGWRIPCAWECRYRKYQQLYEAVAEEWWQLYYNLVNIPIPNSRALFTLSEEHDPLHMFDEKEYKSCLPFNCEVPDMPGLQLASASSKPAALSAPKQKKKRGKLLL